MEASVRKASDKYDEAMKNRDREGFSKLLAEDYHSTDHTGTVRGKKESADFMLDPKLKMESATVSNKNFRVYGNMAVETGEYDVTGSYDGEKFTEKGRYTSTWMFKDGKWQIVADHTSNINRDN